MSGTRNRIGYLFILPAIIYMLLLIGYPLIYNIILSFKDSNLMNLATADSHFVGWRNYREVINSEVFRISLKNTFIYTVASVFFQFVIGFLLALFFNLKFRLASLLRGIVMVSWLIPMTITALLFKFMMGGETGVVNHIFLSLGIIQQPIEWLTNPKMALWGVIIANIWVGVPFNMILLSTGLSSLPEDVYESASLDGANALQKFFYITIPLLRPVIMVVMVLGFIYTFKVFDLVYVMTGGGPVNSTEVLSTYAYTLSFDHFNFGLGAAVANILFLILLIISLIYLWMIQKDEVM
ncbi:multiple sugar transport system permease protein [Caldalkalibacillus uzonensis]|uniref:Multiple sugar transport system permease protein n=1 Tax=Caldalkalibacillus uzonensis TaxID=353224 RepID=A0ABU0CRU8_9BACI|nr:sugar ABC transporter permease [Caldalkalibacillus uzonensis]MDQ0338584.1 multiple sugar transport system permease protein [Caldalkalibacillus uzonensis]